MDQQKLKKFIPALAVAVVIIFVYKSGILNKKSPSLSEPELLPENEGSSLGFLQRKRMDIRKISETADTEEESAGLINIAKLRWVKNIFEPALKADTAEDKAEEEVTGVAVEDLKFTGWMRKGEMVMAMVSDKIVRVGDKLESKKGVLNVVRIEKDMLILQDVYGESYIISSKPAKTRESAGAGEADEAGIEPDAMADAIE